MVALLLVALSTVVDARVPTPGIKNHRESLLTVFTDDGVLPENSDKAITVGFSAFRKNFVLRLSKSYIVDELVTKTYVVDDEGTHEIPTVNRSFIGTVEGDPDSFVSVAIVNGSLKGIFTTRGTTYGIQSRADFDRNDRSGGVIVYRLRDNPLPDYFEDEEDILRERLSESESSETEGAALQLAPESVALAPDRVGNILLSNGQIKRLDIGAIGDYAFVRDAHAGNTDAAIADIQNTVDNVEAITRGSKPRAKGSVPVALRLTQIVVHATESAQVNDGIARCPLTCRNRMYCSTGSEVGSECDNNNDCAGGGQCSGFESNSPGNRCSSNSDCTGTGVFCDQVPNNQKTCVGGTLAGKVCAGNADCGTGTCASSSTVGIDICRGGADDGEICQISGCSTKGNCCASPGACTSPALRAGGTAGNYRSSKHCAGGSNAGAVCTVNSNCPGSTCIAGVITTSNSGKVQLFSGCRLYAGFSAGRICNAGSWTVTQHPEGDSAIEQAGQFAHENGHSLGADHDVGSAVGDTCVANGLVIERNVCNSGANVGKMCGSSSDCGGATCSNDNERFCDGGDNDGDRCIDDDDCPGGTCVGPEVRLCVLGDDDGDVCYPSDATPCASPGTCTGAPMNFQLYPMSGSGMLGGYSPCSRLDILDGSINQSCLTALNCGDVNKSAGAITSIDAQAALLIASDGRYDDLADVATTSSGGGPSGSVTNADSTFLLSVAVGTYSPPTSCGEADVW